MAPPADLLQGTLELLVLKALSLEPLHGWGIGHRIDQLSSDAFQVQQGSLYPALQRMLRKGWIRSDWRPSENSRRARYYVLTARGRRQLEAETAAWRRTAAAVNGILRVRAWPTCDRRSPERLRALVFRRRGSGIWTRSSASMSSGRGRADPERRRARGRPAGGAAGLRRCGAVQGGDAGRARRPPARGSGRRHPLRAARPPPQPGVHRHRDPVLGLGIGATTAVFSVMHSVVLGELPYPDPDRLVRVSQQNSPTNLWTLSTADATPIRDQQRSFEAFGEARVGVTALAGAARRAVLPSGPRRASSMRSARGRPRGVSSSRATSRRRPAGGRGLPAARRSGSAAPDGSRPYPHPRRREPPGDRRAAARPGRARRDEGRRVAGAQAPRPPARSLLDSRHRTAQTGSHARDAARDLAGISARILPLWSDGFRDSLARLTPIRSGTHRGRATGRSDSSPARYSWSCCAR